ncbi:MAG: DUF559 domain-containing protein [Actinobacteria bacterium]|nr:DUF559 domain-containing protein [Actinomycetota bacterium]
MTPTQRILPPELGSTFTVADALTRGVTRRQLDRPGLVRVFHGVRAREGTEADSLPRAFAPRLRTGECFSHVTALTLLGCPVRGGESLHVCVAAPHARNRTRGVIGHRHTAGFIPHFASGGLPVVPPLLALQQSASLLELKELIVAMDHLVLARPYREPTLSVEEIAAVIERSSARGVRQLRRALELARVGAESRMETLTRLLLAAYGLDTFFVLQQEVFDQVGFIGRFDLVDEDRKLIIEYDGEQHRLDRVQYLKDDERLERARAAGYRVIRLRVEDVVRYPSRTAARIATHMGLEVRLRHGAEELLLP